MAQTPLAVINNTLTQHGRRIRRLETLPLGTQASAISVCVTFTCGVIGWRGEGGTTPRTLVHETAFQLDADGNARGTNAVDLQYSRTAATQVASGNYSFAVGQNNTVSGAGGVAFGIGNTVAGPYSLAFGDGNSVPHYATYVFGIDNTLTTTRTFDLYNMVVGDTNEFYNFFHTFVFGKDNYSTAPASAFHNGQYMFVFGRTNEVQTGAGTCFVFGNSNVMSGQPGLSLMFGYYNELNNCDFLYMFGSAAKKVDDKFYNAIVLSDSDLSYPGSCQGNILVNGDTVNPMPYTGWQMVKEWDIPTDTVWWFRFHVLITVSGIASVAAFEIEGVAKNDGGTTSVPRSTVHTYYRDEAVDGFDVRVQADDPNDRLELQFYDHDSLAVAVRYTLRADIEEVYYA